ncbi:MAG: rod shape-determining protein MreC [Clostridia bacterium]
MDFLYRWRRPIITVLLIAILSALLSYTSKLRHQMLTLSSVLSVVTSPVADGMTVAGNRVGLAVGTLGQLFALQQEVVRLKSEVLLLNTMRLELQEVEANNNQLRSLLFLKQKLGSWKLTAATVIGRNPETWFDTVTLNEGSRSGIRLGMPVIVPQGVVGRIISVSPATSQVLLLLDPASGVGAMDVRSRAAGVVVGQDPVTGKLQFQLFSNQAGDVRPGDAIITSGFSHYFPKGLLLGEVSAVSTGPSGLTQIATVIPQVNFNQIETVMVVLAHPAGEAAPPITGGP